MSTLLLTIGVIGTLMLLMALGVMITGRTLRGSCGGPGACECSAAGKPRHSCDADAPIIEVDHLQLTEER